MSRKLPRLVCRSLLPLFAALQPAVSRSGAPCPLCCLSFFWRSRVLLSFWLRDNMNLRHTLLLLAGSGLGSAAPGAPSKSTEPESGKVDYDACRKDCSLAGVPVPNPNKFYLPLEHYRTERCLPIYVGDWKTPSANSTVCVDFIGTDLVFDVASFPGYVTKSASVSWQVAGAGQPSQRFNDLSCKPAGASGKFICKLPFSDILGVPASTKTRDLLTGLCPKEGREALSFYLGFSGKAESTRTGKVSEYRHQFPCSKRSCHGQCLSHDSSNKYVKLSYRCSECDVKPCAGSSVYGTKRTTSTRSYGTWTPSSYSTKYPSGSSTKTPYTYGTKTPSSYPTMSSSKTKAPRPRVTRTATKRKTVVITATYYSTVYATIMTTAKTTQVTTTTERSTATTYTHVTTTKTSTGTAYTAETTTKTSTTTAYTAETTTKTSTTTAYTATTETSTSTAHTAETTTKTSTTTAYTAETTTKTSTSTAYTATTTTSTSTAYTGTTKTSTTTAYATTTTTKTSTGTAYAKTTTTTTKTDTATATTKTTTTKTDTATATTKTTTTKTDTAYATTTQTSTSTAYTTQTSTKTDYTTETSTSTTTTVAATTETSTSTAHTTETSTKTDHTTETSTKTDYTTETSTSTTTTVAATTETSTSTAHTTETSTKTDHTTETSTSTAFTATTATETTTTTTTTETTITSYITSYTTSYVYVTTTGTSTTGTLVTVTSTSTTTQPPPATRTCNLGTAFGYQSASTSNQLSGTCGSNRWGWYQPVDRTTLRNGVSGNLYVGAGGNNLNAAILVGTWTADADQANGDLTTFTYNLNPGYQLTEVHIDFDCTVTCSPGQMTFNGGSAVNGLSVYAATLPYPTCNPSTSRIFTLHAVVRQITTDSTCPTTVN